MDKKKIIKNNFHSLNFIKKIKFNKRGGIAFKTLIFAFYRIIVLLTVTLMLWIFVSYFVKLNVDVDGVEAEIFAQGLINSPNGTSYKDAATNRVYPGVIDFEKYNSGKLEEQLMKAFYFEENNYIAAEIHLLDKEKKPYNNVGKKYYNKEKFNRWYQMGKTGFTGAGAAKVYEKIYPIQIINQDKMEYGLLKIIIAIPNS
jgi:hypothetical protein